MLEETKKEIAQNIASEIKKNLNIQNSYSRKSYFRKFLISKIVQNMKEKGMGERKVKEKVGVTILPTSKNNSVEAAFKKADEKIGSTLEKLNDSEDKGEKPTRDIEEVELDDLDDDLTLAELKELEKKGVRIIYPNLKYKKPKYQNVGEVLKYVESEGGDGSGVKLVIMNFND